MNFFKREWFKVAILIFGCVFLYVFYITSLTKSTEPHPVKSLPEKTSISTTTPVQAAQPVRSGPPKRITSQIAEFDDFLEYKIIPADLDCMAFAVYGNVLSTGTMDAETFKTAFPETKIRYESNCQQEFVDMNRGLGKLIAEPELQSARDAISTYADTVKSFALYVLDGGYASARLNAYEPQAKSLRTLAREEVLKYKRKYGVTN